MFVSYEIKKARYYCVRRADPCNKVKLEVKMSDAKPAKPHGAFAQGRRHETERKKKPQHPSEARLINANFDRCVHCVEPRHGQVCFPQR
jgi:hypothetical protein